MDDGLDLVFKALADPTRRLLLDRLHARNGQTLGELCQHLEMTRQSATQHLGVLEAANLVATVRRGREKLHYLNPVPLQEIEERWIDKFERPRLQALRAIQQQAEEAMADKPAFVYVIYIHSTPDRVWQALTDADLTARYWGHSNVSDWQAGSRWEHQRTDGSGVADVAGTVIESEPPRRLVATWAAPSQDGPDGPDGPDSQASQASQASQDGQESDGQESQESPDGPDPSRVTFDIEPYGDIVRLTVSHDNLADGTEREGVAAGWAAVLSNLKSLLETGHALPQQPWEMPASVA